MNQPIAGVAPAELAEVTCKVVWPTIGATRAGRLVGRLAAVRLGWGEFFTLGKLLAVATIPLSLAVFCWQLMPYVCRRYTLTNRRIIVRKGLMPMDQRWIELDDFETIDVEVLPGQGWLHAGDLIFRRGGNEVLRLQGVSRPEVFRHVCLTVRNAFVYVCT
jgi:hypothetical protein